MSRVQNVLNDFRIRDQMQPELIEDWLRERLEWEFVAAENDALERAAQMFLEWHDGYAAAKIRELKHPSN